MDLNNKNVFKYYVIIYLNMYILNILILIMKWLNKMKLYCININCLLIKMF